MSLNDESLATNLDVISELRDKAQIREQASKTEQQEDTIPK